MNMNKKDFTKWTRKEFESLPTPQNFTNEEVGEVDSLVILPCKHYHDSGFRCMEFVTIQKGEPTYRLSGCSDVLHLSGIGGYNVGAGYFDEKKLNQRCKTRFVPLNGWCVDCLPTSGLLRIFCDKKMYVGSSLSSFEIYFKED